MIFERYFARNVISREVSVPAVIVGHAWVIRASCRALVCGLLCHLVGAFFVLVKCLFSLLWCPLSLLLAQKEAFVVNGFDISQSSS